MKLWSAIGFGLMGGAILWFAPAASACSCATAAPFVKAASASTLVVRGKVLEYQWHPADTKHERPQSMVVEVQEVLRGVTSSKRVTIAGDNGMICRRYVSEFPVGTAWVLAVSPDQWSEKGELAISSCGEYALKVQDNKVQGRISPRAKASESMTLANLRKLLKVKTKAAFRSGRPIGLL
jgi:hypothetical protein